MTLPVGARVRGATPIGGSACERRHTLRRTPTHFMEPLVSLPVIAFITHLPYHSPA